MSADSKGTIGPHLSLPVEAREAMRRPLGPVILGVNLGLHLKRSDTIVTVGDMVTLTLVDDGYPVAMALFDFKTLREEGEDFRERLGKIKGDRTRVRNPPATITKDLWDALAVAYEKVKGGERVLLEVEGEEDLAALPAIMLAPDGAKVLYGMPGRGIVVVSCNRASRRLARGLLELMEPRDGWKGLA
jgi:uncharacterized protein (UPF0218 family)